jgi:hypothetical protein
LDLCSTHYGFLQLPSLVVFVNIHSQYPEVHEILTSGTPLSDMIRASAELPSDQRRDMAHRVTTWIHERRHFHDVLLTPVGNALFFGELSRVATLVALLPTLRHFQGSILRLPITTDTEGLGEYVQAYELFATPYSRIVESARQALEASAVAAQLTFAIRHIGDDGLVRLVADFFSDPRYGDPLSRFGQLAYGEPNQRSLTVSYSKLLLLILSSHPYGRQTSHDDTLRKLLDASGDARLKGKRASALKGVVADTWNIVTRDIALSAGRNEACLDGLAKVLSMKGASPALSDVFRGVAAEFISAAADMRKRVIEDPDEYCDMARYLKAKWPQPIAATFVSGGGYQFVDADASGCPFNRELWSNFAVALVPHAFLAEDPPFAHPLMQVWRHNLEHNLGVRIARRRRSRGVLSLGTVGHSLKEGAGLAGGAKRGRNESCWCDSGRKFKKCHGR